MKQLDYLVRQAEELSAHCARADAHDTRQSQSLVYTSQQSGGGGEVRGVGLVVVRCVCVCVVGGYKSLIKSPNIIFH